MTDRARQETLRINAICLGGMRDAMQIVLEDLQDQRRTLQRSGMQDSILDEKILALNTAIYNLNNRVIDPLRSLIWR